MMADEPDWVPAGVDAERASIARIYDYWLGGSHNFPVDQEVGRAMLAIEPYIQANVQANRAFLGRATRFLADTGICQFLDIGSGIPTQGNAHEVAQRADPSARVVYADIDPAAIAQSTAILAGNQNAAIIDADFRDPEKILAHPATQDLIDFDQPVGMLLVSVLHFITDAENPRSIVATLRDALAPGSYLVLSHGTPDARPDLDRAATELYNRSVAQTQVRSGPEILPFFEGFELVDPGLVYPALWRPDSLADEPGDPSQFRLLAGVARKP